MLQLLQTIDKPFAEKIRYGEDFILDIFYPYCVDIPDSKQQIPAGIVIFDNTQQKPVLAQAIKLKTGEYRIAIPLNFLIALSDNAKDDFSLIGATRMAVGHETGHIGLGHFSDFSGGNGEYVNAGIQAEMAADLYGLKMVSDIAHPQELESSRRKGRICDSINLFFDILSKATLFDRGKTELQKEIVMEQIFVRQKRCLSAIGMEKENISAAGAQLLN